MSESFLSDEFVRRLGQMLVPASLAHCSLVQQGIRYYERMVNLAVLSGKTVQFIRDELAVWPGTIAGLENYYLMEGCFPSEAKHVRSTNGKNDRNKA